MSVHVRDTALKPGESPPIVESLRAQQGQDGCREGFNEAGGPKTVREAFFQQAVRLPPVVRWAVLIIGGLMLGLFAVWNSLPGEVQVDLLRLSFVRTKSVAVSREGPSLEKARISLSGESVRAQKLVEAKNHMEIGGVGSNERALALYREVAGRLDARVLRVDDRALLLQAIQDDEDGHVDAALLKYRVAFASLERSIN